MAVAVYTLIFLGLVATSPITDPLKQNLNFALPKGGCYLPPELGHGKAVLLEDCNNLGEEINISMIQSNIDPSDSFEMVPVPENQNFKYNNFILVPFVILFLRFGTHAIVCCPGYSSSSIFFLTDPAHPDYVAPDYGDSDGAGSEDYYDGASPKDYNDGDGNGANDYYDGSANAQFQEPPKVTLKISALPGV